MPSRNSATREGPVVLSSSRPSAPCTTQARSVPNCARTWAIGSTHSPANTPMSCRLAPAGLASGPSRLKIVRVPSSTRAPATWRMAPWWRGAIMKPIPAPRIERSTSATSASMLTPSAVRTSAEPARDDSARLPCLATGTPQAATTIAAAVEMLKVPDASPPVPQVSIAVSGARTLSMRSRSAWAPPVSSSTVSPRTRSPMRKPPTCAGVASPDIMISKASRASLRVNGSPEASRPSSAFILSGVALTRCPPAGSAPGSCRAGDARARSRCFRGETARRGSAARDGGPP